MTLHSRPAWQDEHARAAALMESLTGKSICSYASSNVCHYYLLIQPLPFERIVGIISYAPKYNEPRNYLFLPAILPDYEAKLSDFLQSFRQHLQDKDAKWQHLITAEMLPEDSPLIPSITAAGFSPFLTNEVFTGQFSQYVSRMEQAKKRYGSKLAIPPYAGLVKPDASHIPAIIRLCSELYDLLTPTAIHAAFQSDSAHAGFHPAVSCLYLENGEVRGAYLNICQHGHIRVPVRVVDPQALQNTGIVCHWMFEHSINAVLPQNPSHVHFRGDPVTHAETIRLAKRYHATLTQRLIQFRFTHPAAFSIA